MSGAWDSHARPPEEHDYHGSDNPVPGCPKCFPGKSMLKSTATEYARMHRWHDTYEERCPLCESTKLMRESAAELTRLGHAAHHEPDWSCNDCVADAVKQAGPPFVPEANPNPYWVDPADWDKCRAKAPLPPRDFMPSMQDYADAGISRARGTRVVIRTGCAQGHHAFVGPDNVYNFSIQRFSPEQAGQLAESFLTMYESDGGDTGLLPGWQYIGVWQCDDDDPNEIAKFINICYPPADFTPPPRDPPRPLLRTLQSDPGILLVICESWHTFTRWRLINRDTYAARTSFLCVIRPETLAGRTGSAVIVPEAASKLRPGMEEAMKQFLARGGEIA